MPGIQCQFAADVYLANVLLVLTNSDCIPQSAEKPKYFLVLLLEHVVSQQYSSFSKLGFPI